jgi:hypothetical protein
MTHDPSIEGVTPLQRRLGLPLLVLYGTGITIGAGIYMYWLDRSPAMPAPTRHGRSYLPLRSWR